MKRLTAFLLVCLLLITGCAAPAGTGLTTMGAEDTTTVTSHTGRSITTVPDLMTTDGTVTRKPVTEGKPITSIKTTSTTQTTTTSTTTTTTTKRVTTTTKPQATLRVLSIGNSYSMDAHHFLADLAAHEGKNIRTVNLYHSGCSLKKHYEFWKSNEAAYQYEVNGDIDWNSHVSLLDILPSEPWDVITLQDSSYSSCTSGNMQPYLNELLAVIRMYRPAAKIYLHQTWAYGDNFGSHSSATGGTMAAMWAKIKVNYEQTAAQTGLPLIPSGLAMFNAQQAFNARGLGESIQRDESHASESWGRYLLALVWYKTLTGETPSNTFEAFDGWHIEDADVRRMIHDTAMEAVAAYYPK